MKPVPEQSPLYAPSVIQLIRLKAIDLGVQLTDAQVLAVVKSLEWVRINLEKKKP